MRKIVHMKMKSGNRETSKEVRVRNEDRVSQVIKIMGIRNMSESRNHQVLLINSDVGVKE